MNRRPHLIFVQSPQRLY